MSQSRIPRPFGLLFFIFIFAVAPVFPSISSNFVYARNMENISAATAARADEADSRDKSGSEADSEDTSGSEDDETRTVYYRVRPSLTSGWTLKDQPTLDASDAYVAQPGEIVRVVERVGAAPKPGGRYLLVDGIDEVQRQGTTLLLPVRPLFAQELPPEQVERFEGKPPRQGFLHFSKGGSVRVYGKPGYDRLDCQSGTIQNCLDIDDVQTPVEILDSQILLRPDPFELVEPGKGKIEYANYYRVRLHPTKQNKLKKPVEGWVHSGLVSNQPMPGVKAPNCPPETAAAQSLADIVKSAPAAGDLADEQRVDLLLPHIGSCLLQKNPAQKPKETSPSQTVQFRTPELSTNTLPLNQFVTQPWQQRMRKNKVKLDSPYPLGKSAGTDVGATYGQMMQMDALARTCYGEIAVCHQYGYPVFASIGRITLNRAEYYQDVTQGVRTPATQHPFVLPSDAGNTPALVKVLATDRQYSIWNRDNPTQMKQVLCPPADKDQHFWSGAKPSSTELKIWRHCVNVAAQTVLDPAKLKAQTAELNEIYQYTSGVNPFNVKAYKRVIPTVGDLKITDGKCLKFWELK